MASVIDLYGSSLYYSIQTGEPHEFVLNLQTLYSKAECIEVAGWMQLLAEWVKSSELDKPSPRYGGLPAYIYWMRERGLLEAEV